MQLQLQLDSGDLLDTRLFLGRLLGMGKKARPGPSPNSVCRVLLRSYFIKDGFRKWPQDYPSIKHKH
jgi:hypothetical protein